MALPSEAATQTAASARDFERGLPPGQRKRLGQYFTGLPLGTLLASLAYDRPLTVLDPMVGHGDLLDSVLTVLHQDARTQIRLDGVEVDDATAAFARQRIHASMYGPDLSGSILAGSAFSPAVAGELVAEGYDLVITNPPYVRYQSQGSQTPGEVRYGLKAIARTRSANNTAALWDTLIEGYSGLADLSIPSCLMAGLLCRPGGRLAIVMPATWRSRDYADAIRYLLLRFFDLEFVVADTQPGWFSDALVRTHLIVARRRLSDDALVPINQRTAWPSPRWIEIAPDAATATSLVGRAFPGNFPEQEFAAWARQNANAVSGIEVRPFDLQAEWHSIRQRLSEKSWFHQAEGTHQPLPLFANAAAFPHATIPDAIRTILSPKLASSPLVLPKDLGIRVGQGLRTGCNRFFYVDRIGAAGKKMVEVKTSAAFSHGKIHIPAECLRSVVHRQSDLPEVEQGRLPSTMVLNLDGWVLPEDMPLAQAAADNFAARGLPLPRIMPPELAEHVRRASLVVLDPTRPNERIPDLSAVRTNVRAARARNEIPRFWYMLPAFAARHEPTIFSARINHRLPRVIVNPGLIVDANFSTIWPGDSTWTGPALYALFSSVWVRAAMEALGVPMGGGAAKLEATHLRQLPLPALDVGNRKYLHALGARCLDGETKVQIEIDHFVLRAVFPALSPQAASQLALQLDRHQDQSREARQRWAS